MKSIKIIFILLFTSYSTFGQKILSVDFDAIKLEIEDSNSTNYYPLLLEQFSNFDSTLTLNEYKLLYYGSTFQKKYSPYGADSKESAFYKEYNTKNFKAAIPIGEEILKENPINVTLLFKLMVSHFQLDEETKSKNYARSYYRLLDVIYNSGDGSSIKTAYVVINVSDEYQIISDLRLFNTSQALVGVTDVLTIDTKNQKVEKGQKKIKELYFNVSKPLSHLNQMFKEKE